MTALLYLAERKIEEAIARGEFDDLPGAGRPLDLDDAGYRLNDADESAERARARKRLALLHTRIEPRYYEKVLASLG